MRVSLQWLAKKSMRVKDCAARLLVKRPVVVEKKVPNGRSQWFSHVR